MWLNQSHFNDVLLDIKTWWNYQALTIFYYKGKLGFFFRDETVSEHHALSQTSNRAEPLRNGLVQQAV